MMKEYYLQMAWKLSVLAGKKLQTLQGDALEIISPGQGPVEQGGPDFTLAKIRLNNTLWVGSVEVHVKSSMWYDHKHDKDPKYANVILHVVWEQDREVCLQDGTEIPTIQLKDYLDQTWFDQVEQHLSISGSIACTHFLPNVPEVLWQSQLDSVLVERLERKVLEIEQLYYKCGADWDECLHRLIARYMGQKVNNDAMEQLATSLPYKIIQKHENSLSDVEALLFGQAGFLNPDHKNDEYFMGLKQRYVFWSYKYNLVPAFELSNQWQYKGLRPAGFPEPCIAWWAYLLVHKGRLMNWVVNQDILLLMKEEQGIGDYWTKHYRFTKQRKSIAMGNSQKINGLLLNAVIPFRIAYKKLTEQIEVSSLLHYYEAILPEKNRIVDVYLNLGYQSISSRDTQALLELYNKYCNYKKCLSCKIGHHIFKQEGML